MKIIYIISSFIFLTLQLKSQVISGKVLDTTTGKPIEYVSIGIVNTTIGAITNENGFFKIDVTGQNPKAEVRVSIIGYKGQTFTLDKLTEHENIIKLIETSTQIAEVVILQSGKERKVGTTSCSWKSSCGWSITPNKSAAGYEIGLKLELGTQPVKIKSFNIRIYNQPFDTVFLRLHIRNINNNLPLTELLVSNIIVPVAKEKGWEHFDLTKYNLVLKGDIALTVEWVKYIGVHKDRFVRMNNSKEATANLLFNSQKRTGVLFAKWGAEAPWNLYENESPSMYVTVQ